MVKRNELVLLVMNRFKLQSRCGSGIIIHLSCFCDIQYSCDTVLLPRVTTATGFLLFA